MWGRGEGTGTGILSFRWACAGDSQLGEEEWEERGMAPRLERPTRWKFCTGRPPVSKDDLLPGVLSDFSPAALGGQVWLSLLPRRRRTEKQEGWRTCSVLLQDSQGVQLRNGAGQWGHVQQGLTAQEVDTFHSPERPSRGHRGMGQMTPASHSERRFQMVPDNFRMSCLSARMVFFSKALDLVLPTINITAAPFSAGYILRSPWSLKPRIGLKSLGAVFLPMYTSL